MNVESRNRGKPTAPAASQPTRLQRWLAENGFTSAQLEAASGVSRQQMTKIRAGGDVRRKTMIRICRGASILAGRVVRMDELFDLDPYSAENLRLVPAA